MDSVRGDGASGGFRRAGCCGIVRIRLRRLAARVHGRKSQRLISSIRRVASSLTSRRATMADRLATSALDGIGRSGAEDERESVDHHGSASRSVPWRARG
jgi:hypothetical protein